MAVDVATYVASVLNVKQFGQIRTLELRLFARIVQSAHSLQVLLTALIAASFCQNRAVLRNSEIGFDSRTRCQWLLWAKWELQLVTK
jgi:hypothetical protein